MERLASLAVPMPKKTARKLIADSIRIRGAKQNNLKGIDLDLPLGKLNVITGPSGSGKSSLAFDTIYAEGQRRYVETFSPYTRQFFERMDKPKVDSIEGIPPAIAIEQVNNMRSTRSTVGTITEINDYLKMIFPRLAEATCPGCKRPVRPETPESIVRELLSAYAEKQALILFPVPVPKNAVTADFAAFLQSQGFVRVWLYGNVIRLDDAEALKGRKLPAQVLVVQDRVALDAKQRSRLSEALEAALRYGKGHVTCVMEASAQCSVPSTQSRSSKSKTEHCELSTEHSSSAATSTSILQKSFSTDWSCADCGITLPTPTPGLFSFNSPIGACPTCRGFGRTLGIDIGKAIPDESLSINLGLVRPFQGSTYGESQLDLERAARKRGIDIHKAFDDYTPEERHWLIEGTDPDPEVAYNRGEWYGVRGFFKWMESRSYKMHVRVFLSRYRAYTECGDCGGGRLKKDAYAFRIGPHTIADLWRMPVSELHPLVQTWPLKEGDHAAKLLRDEIASRVSYMDRAGLGYLNLDRQTRTLSGGELQRVNLTTCLGASLVNTLFVLDEPSIGLHPRDIGRLIGVMEGLRDKGNTLLVVEHEEAVMQAADNLIDIGPGRGEKGGELVFNGPLEKLSKTKGSLTGDYLFGRKSIPVPTQRRSVVPPLGGTKTRPPKGGTTNTLSIRSARQNNLRKLDADIPLHAFVCITGVSGSGKSTLVHDVLYRNLQKLRGEVCEDEPGRVGSISGWEQLGSVVMVDQSPLARTPRSTPAVFTGAFDHIRTLFAACDDAATQGIMPGFFSFNSGEGRCERCMGNGFEKIEMQFLSDLFVTCPECEGKRYKPHALKILLNGKSIHDVLSMTIDDAVPWFASIEHRAVAAINRSLQLVIDAGLGYLRLGQPLNTLSGGEAQRLKLVGHLLEPQTPGKSSLLLLDEPTTGLHFDDIALLIKLLQRLVDEGNSLVVIEHNLEVIKCADWVLDLGPEGGAGGGTLVIAGTPEDVAECTASHTGQYLRDLLFQTTRERPGVLQPSGAFRGPEDARKRQRTGALQDAVASNAISIRGAREHNLKNISLDIPRDEFVVVTGLSGSGKSSLAFDLIFAEGQRRFLDSMSVYARTFVEQMEKPEVDLISGVPPTVAIEQRISRGGGKSTVATVTETYHFLRLLFAKLGTQHCPKCAVAVKKQSAEAILKTIQGHLRTSGGHLLAPLIKARKGFHTDVAENAAKHGIETLWVDGEFKPTMGFKRLERFKEHSIDAVIAKVGKGENADVLRPHIETALKMGKGTIKLRLADKTMHVLSTEMSCPSCGLSFEELDPRLFSFNSPHGWCKDCRGFGYVGQKRDLNDRNADVSMLEAELEEERRFNSDDDENAAPRQLCPTCNGSRINEIGRAVQLQKSTIQDFSSLTAGEAGKLIAKLKFEGTEAIIARDIVKEIEQRLKFMQEVGLGYLQLNRSADTLSGGEAQRIRLSAQLGSNLRGVLYVLDEPTIGLHPRDNEKLLNTLTALRDKGNSLLVVEHDDETMKRADTILDLGPGAGKFGGEVVAQGTLAHLLKSKQSVTGQSLKHPLKHPSRGTRRPLPSAKSKDGWLRVTGATANNLKNIDVSIPLGRLTVLTGVSGSGKSSFMHGALSPAVREKISKAKIKVTKAWKTVSGFENLQTVHEVDQSPIGKTSRSCPATYVGILDDIRALFAQVPLARTRGYTASRFSFNTEGGRCETCGGNGAIKVEMAFLPTTRVHCETCHGLRFNAATLEIEYNNKHIGDVLRMSITEAAEFFAPVQKIARPLKLLADTGLGYLQLGQPSPTLSGGEAQRIKLVTELRSGDGKTIKEQLKGIQKVGKRNLYLIEEP
ncbi:MAG: excinuclease subunit UvrA, partial [Verrucomicrobiota bacterium]